MVRSSLEEMLENLRRMEEQPKDIPPVLPSRPTSRARLPSSRRSLPVGFKVGADDDGKRKSDEIGISAIVSVSVRSNEENMSEVKEESTRRKNSFGSSKKKMKLDQSPYGAVEEERANVAGGGGGSGEAVMSPTTPASHSDWHDNIDYFIQKVIYFWSSFSI